MVVDSTWMWCLAVIVEYRVQKIAEVSFLGVAADSVLTENVLAACTLVTLHVHW